MLYPYGDSHKNTHIYLSTIIYTGLVLFVCFICYAGPGSGGFNDVTVSYADCGLLLYLIT